MLNAVSSNLWELNYPHRVFGFLLGRRLTVVKLTDGSLWVHASLAPTAALTTALATLGTVTHIIGPNIYHDAYLPEFVAAYPEARFHSAPGLLKANRRLRADAVLGTSAPPEWSTSIDQHLVAGLPGLNEVAFFHRSSRTLILADLAFNIGPPCPTGTRIALKMYGAWNRFGPSRVVRALIKDRAAFRASVAYILAWDFDRIIVGHGRVVETNGKEVFRNAFARL